MTDLMNAWWEGCNCWTCTWERVDVMGSLSMPMCLCPECGNKRCPKATHHDNACGMSNEPGQPGSRYPKIEEKPLDVRPLKERLAELEAKILREDSSVRED